MGADLCLRLSSREREKDARSTMELIQAVCLTPAFDFVERQGVNVDKHLSAVGLGAFKARNPKSWLPKELVFNFIRRLNKYELSSKAIEDLEPAFRLRYTHHYGEYLLSAINMLAAAKRVTDPRSSVLTYHSMTVGFQSARTVLVSRYEHDYDIAEEIIEGLSLVLMLDAMVEFGPNQCRIPELDITLDRLPETSLPIDWSRTVVRISRSEHKVIVPLSWLPRSARTKMKTLNENGWAPNRSFSGRLLKLLDALELGRRPTIELVSESTGVAKRTIQRNLAKERTSFFKLIDDWTAGKAIAKINNPDVSLSELSEQLGYSDLSHFNRAFRRWTGRNPSTYRGSEK